MRFVVVGGLRSFFKSNLLFLELRNVSEGNWDFSDGSQCVSQKRIKLLTKTFFSSGVESVEFIARLSCRNNVSFLLGTALGNSLYRASVSFNITINSFISDF